MKDTKKIVITCLSLVIVFILLMKNPSYESFKSYLLDNKLKDESAKENSNLFLFSIYSTDSNTYIGISGCFIRI